MKLLSVWSWYSRAQIIVLIDYILLKNHGESLLNSSSVVYIDRIIITVQ